MHHATTLLLKGEALLGHSAARESGHIKKKGPRLFYAECEQSVSVNNTCIFFRLHRCDKSLLHDYVQSAENIGAQFVRLQSSIRRVVMCQETFYSSASA